MSLQLTLTKPNPSLLHRLRDHSAGDRSKRWRDVPPDAGRLDIPGSGQLQFPGLWRDLWLLGFYLLRLAPVFPQDAPWMLISSYPGQTTWNGKLGVLPEVKLGEGGRRRHPAS